METRWWWIRHAPVPDGGRIYGQRDLDCDCSEARVFQALAAELPDDAVWVTSNLARTHQTAEAIRIAMKAEFQDRPRAIPALAEQHLGDWQGLDRQTFLTSRRSDSNPFWFGPASERAPNGESFDDLVARVRGAIDDLSRELTGRDVIAVTHGGTIRAAIALALQLDADAALGCVIDNCSLTRLDRTASGRWRVRCVNHRPWLGVNS
jgi:broad specificity phosphatase PhoE